MADVGGEIAPYKVVELPKNLAVPICIARPAAALVAAPLGEQLAIVVVELEVAREPSGCRFDGLGTVAILLFFGQEIDKHGGACAAGVFHR